VNFPDNTIANLYISIMLCYISLEYFRHKDLNERNIKQVKMLNCLEICPKCYIVDYQNTLMNIAFYLFLNIYLLHFQFTNHIRLHNE